MITTFIFALIFVITAFVVFPVGMAVTEGRGQMGDNNGIPRDPLMVGNLFLERLQTAYETANIPLIASLYNDPTVAVDVTRDENHFYTAEGMQADLEKALKGLTGIKCSFTDRQITAAGDMIMIRALRSVTANEVPIIANCLMLMILRKELTKDKTGEYLVTDQILLKEEYVQKSDSGG